MASKPHGNTGLRTVKIRPLHRPAAHADVPLAQLKRELEAGVAHFFGRRPHLHQPGRGLSYLDFTNRKSA